MSGGYTFSADGLGLVPVMFPGSPTLHSLAPAYWTPTYCTNTLSLRPLKLYSGFLGVPRESLSSCTFRDSQGQTFSIKTTSKNNLDYINIHFVKNYQSHPKGPHHLLSPIIISISHNLNAHFIHQHFVHTSHQRILQMAKLGIYTGLTKYIPKLSHLCHACLIAKVPCLPPSPNCFHRKT